MSLESLIQSKEYHPVLYQLLAKVASELRPTSYLEIGVREGDSLRVVLEASEGSIRRLVLCDIWKGEGGHGHLNHNHIDELLKEVGYSGEVEFLDGDSRKTVPELIHIHDWKAMPNTVVTASIPPLYQFYCEECDGQGVGKDQYSVEIHTGGKSTQLFDMILVDGDHSIAGAQTDLMNTWPLLRVGGTLLLDDIGHSAHPYLGGVFKQFCAQVGAQIITEETDRSSGTAVCRKVTGVKAPIAAGAPKTAVVLRFGGFGDVLWAEPVCRKLKEDGYKVILHTFSYAAPVVESDPNIDEIYIHPMAQLARQITMPQNSRVIDLVNLGHVLEGGYYFGCVNHSMAFKVGCEHCEKLKQYRDEDIGKINYEENVLIRADQRTNSYHPTVYFTETEAKEAQSFVESLGWNEKYIVIWSAASTIEHKIYPYWFEVAKQFTARHEDAVVYSVGNEHTQAFQASAERIIPVVGDWPLRKSILLGTMANLIVGTETGYMNTVAYFPVPKIVLLSHSSPDNLTKHWQNTTTLCPDVPCHPCHQMHFSKLTCPLVKVQIEQPKMDAMWPICMGEGIRPETVLEAMEMEFRNTEAEVEKL